MILLDQLSAMVSLIKDDMTNGKSGTDDTLFLKTQSGLISGVSETDVTLTDKSNTSSTIFGSHVITTALGNGNTLVEFEVNNGSESYNRAVKADLAKTSTIEYTIFHTFTFEVII